jgi:polysaccharide chain length determinant protein (PEP-CTERM system associated)
MERFRQVLEEARAAWRFRWVAIAAAWVVCAVGWVYIATMPNVYEATARVYVDANTGLTPLLQGLTVDQNMDAQLMLVRQSLLTRPALEKVARRTDLHLSATTPRDMERLVLGLQNNIKIENVIEQPRGRSSGDSLYRISYRSSNREKAITVVREVLDTFVENTMGGSRAGSESAQRFLTEQIKEYADRLSAAEQKLAEFKKANLGLVPGQSGDYFARMQAETEAVKRSRSDLALAIGRRDELQRQLRGQQESAVAASGVAVNPLGPTTESAARLVEAQKRLDELLLRYTERHPDVVATRETIRQLQERQQQELQAMREGSGPATAALSASPVYQSIQMSLNQVGVEIAALQRQVAQGEASIAQLHRLANTAPEVEAEFAKLNRDYDVTKAQYNALVERLEKAKLSNEAEETGIVRFDVIDPPVADFQPVAPQRPMMITLLFWASLLVGIGLAYALHMLRPVFMNARTLTEVTGLEVLGTVSETWLGDRRYERKREVFALAGATAGLFLAFGVVYWWQAGGGNLPGSG